MDHSEVLKIGVYTPKLDGLVLQVTIWVYDKGEYGMIPNILLVNFPYISPMIQLGVPSS